MTTVLVISGEIRLIATFVLFAWLSPQSINPQIVLDGGKKHSGNKTAIAIKLPVEDIRLGWEFMFDQVLQSSEVDLLLTRNSMTVTNKIVHGGELCQGWRIDVRGLTDMDGKATLFVGYMNQKILDGDRISVQLWAQTNLWGHSLMMGGYLPAGVYRSGLQAANREITVSPSTTSTVDLVKWEPSWSIVITKFYYPPGDTRLSVMEKAILRLKHKYEYLILSDPELMQTRLYRISPAYAEMLRPQKIESVIGMKMYIERRCGITFPEGTGVFAGPVPLTYLVRNKQGALNKIRGSSNEKNEILFGLYGEFEGWVYSDKSHVSTSGK